MTQTPELVAGPAATRPELLAAITAVLDDSGVLWGWQGASDAVDAWLVDNGPSDLDVWVHAATPELDAALDDLPAARVADGRDDRRLIHTSRAIECSTGLAVLDVTAGDLRVGPVLLVPAADVTVSPGLHGPHLSGVAAAADLLVRPLLRGRLPKPHRLAEARRAWNTLASAQRSSFKSHLSAELGAHLAEAIATTLDGMAPSPSLPKAVRRRLLRRTLSPSGLPAAWAQRRSVLPAGDNAGPLGLRAKGVVVVLVGTDGSGKSTVARQLGQRLERCGFTVDEAYFGMARGNLPGVNLARKVLRIPATDATSAESVAPKPKVVDDASDLSHAAVRKVAAWFYAFEYAWRYARLVAPSRRRGQIVICDRYVYDLRESPWPGSGAARFAQRIVPAPHVLALPDAPDVVIHTRKPERSFAEQSRQQQAFRDLVNERPAKVCEVVVDTSGSTVDAVQHLVSSVVAAAHGAQRM